MVNFLINGKSLQIGNKLPASINSLSVSTPPRQLPILIPSAQVPLLKQWLNTVITNCTCEYIEFNRILIKTDEINLFKL